MRTFRIAMVQMNPTVGDLDGNVRRIIGWLRDATKAKPLNNKKSEPFLVDPRAGVKLECRLNP